MTSPFLKIPSSEWVASNDRAFAIRDKYPVNEGHTLVIPRRLVATWFDATREEQLAILELIDAVKAQLDAERCPHGYNVGFNAGLAAGQTVMHLHVHVIPRYEGDMDDPRGGVRHVIPHKGNYLREKTKPLATGGDKDPFFAHVEPLFAKATDIAILAAFIQDSGLELLSGPIESALARGAKIRVLTGDYLEITQVEALKRLLNWTLARTGDAAEGDAPASGELLAQVFETTTSKTRRSFHPKSWRFEGPNLAVAFVGSSNVSHSALRTGIEWNLRLERGREPQAWAELIQGFDDLWRESKPLTQQWVDAYAERARRNPSLLPPGEITAEIIAPPDPPHEIQEQALEALEASRDAGRSRAMVVLATGLGKTNLAAWDARALIESRRPERTRVLFIAHRAELLRQAADTFLRVLRPVLPDARFTWCIGSSADLSGDAVFASVLKLGRPAVLAKVAPDAFDYVVVDEVHHADAATYRRILDHLHPKFLLGLTATPERADQGDVLGLFDDNVPYRADLGVGIQAGRLVPFVYYGIKDTADYSPTNIPWQNQRFDPEALERAVQTQARMEQFWEAWKAHPGTRSLIFCCSIRHARFVTEWLSERGVRIDAVFHGEGSADRAESLKRLANGDIDAICSVDLFNEGIDVPMIDRVVMLRPTESPVVFIQQLGRGLRKPKDGIGKDRLTVIDFVGNHRVFLNRVRTLLSLAGSKQSLEAFLREGIAPELPPGCDVVIELTAIQLLEKLLPRGQGEVQRLYQLVAARGERPRAGELYRMGANLNSLRPTYDTWFDFVRSEGGLTEAEARVLEASKPFLRAVETEAMTKSFKMITLEALIEADALMNGLPLSEVAARSHRILARSPELFADLEGVKELGDPKRPDPKVFTSYWRKNPVNAWAKKEGRAFFKVEGDRFVPDIPVSEGDEATLVEMTRELVDYRLAWYRQRNKKEATGSGFECKVTWNQRDPILKLPSRKKGAEVPEGELDVRVRDGSPWQFRFMKEYCNVARPVGAPRNQLPDLLRSWFGASAGMPGTEFHVRFSRSPDGWWVEPVGKVLKSPERGKVIAFPTLRAAAGAANGATPEPPEAEEVSLPIPERGTDFFAIRASGDSMDGGKNPIRDGDWVVMRWARGAALGAVEGRVALVQVQDPHDGQAYQLKRIVREGQSWALRSDNPERPSYSADEKTVPLATTVAVIQPESLGPPVGTELKKGDLATAFGLTREPEEGRCDGHLFVFVNDAEELVAPDRVKHPVPGRRPGETAFVLLKRGAGYRYLGVGRWSEGDEPIEVPALDYATWKELDGGRGCSRTLPRKWVREAEKVVDRLLAEPGLDGWIEAAGKKCRIVGRAPKGGIRIDGGQGGFKERSVSFLDIGWALAAAEEVRREGGVLDEARVNRLRYIEGTPKESTRWIDTGWALGVLVALQSL